MSHQHDYLKSEADNNKQSQAGKYLTPFQRKLLQKSLQGDLSTKYRQRLQIMLLTDEGVSQAEICQELGCSQATARHWILMARTGEAHNWQSNPIGRPKALDEKYVERLKELVSNSPKEFGYFFGRWTAQWLGKHLAKEFGVELSPRHINRLLKKMGLSTRGQTAATEDTILGKGINVTGEARQEARGKRQEGNAKTSSYDRFKYGKAGDRLVISNLDTNTVPESPQLWSFNPWQIG